MDENFVVGNLVPLVRGVVPNERAFLAIFCGIQQERIQILELKGFGNNNGLGILIIQRFNDRLG
jgi:hypothetical protein